MNPDRHLVLLEGAAEWSGRPAVLVHWDRSDVAAGRESVPRLVARAWRDLRADYLAWIHDIGETPVRGGTLRGALRLDQRVPSYWWMTLMAEKSPMKSRTVYTVFKLRAFEMLCETLEAGAVTYAGHDARIDAVLARWCRETRRTYLHAPPAPRPRRAAPDVMGRRVRFLPHALRGLAWLGWTWWTRVRPVRARRAGPPASGRAADCAVVTFFPNCDMAKLRDGIFRSSYWQELHDLFDRMPSGVDWTWLYADSADASLSDTLDHRDRCNAGGGGQRFRLLEEHIGPRVFAGVLCTWARLALRAPSLIRAGTMRPLPGSRMSLRPIVIEDWKASLTGIVAAEAAYYAGAFEAMTRASPAPRRAIYQFENQPWEQALVAAWRRHGVDCVVAHQHEAVKPLNLRLFADARTCAESGSDAKPLPDVLAVGSAQACDAFIETGFPHGRVRLVESLRFRNAAAVAPIAGRSGGAVLLVTGYLAPETRRMLTLSAEAQAAGAFAACSGILIKPHPFLPIDDILGAYQFSCRVEVTGEPLETLWPRTAFAFLANSTAAVFDALAAGVPFGVCEPDDDFNLSPALGWDDVPMIADAGALVAAVAGPPKPRRELAMFCTDAALPRWAALIAAPESGAAQSGRPDRKQEA